MSSDTSLRRHFLVINVGFPHLRLKARSKAPRPWPCDLEGEYVTMDVMTDVTRRQDVEEKSVTIKQTGGLTLVWTMTASWQLNWRKMAAIEVTLTPPTN